jgi:hypothetical protein
MLFIAVILATASLAGCASLAQQKPSLVIPSVEAAASPGESEMVNVPSGRRAPDPTSTPTSAPTPEPPFSESFVFGRSFGGRPLVAYRLGNGPIARALIGGLHGGYEWNTTTLMSQTLDHLLAAPDLIPTHLTLYIIPLANPDGAAAGTAAERGRMNGNGVDLNRNWDYEWRPEATHGTQPVFAGSSAFSEPETAALRNFILDHAIDAVIFYHSAGGVVFSGAGHDTSATVELAEWLADQTGYRYAPEGVPGQITTGNAIDWLTTHGIDAVEIELSTHEDLDWEANLKGILAYLGWRPRLTEIN